MRSPQLRFSIARHAAWAPGLTAPQHWAEWARAPFAIGAGADPAVRAMPPMLRRRAGLLGKMALEVAYACLEGQSEVPTVFCSRHGEVARAVELLSDLARGEPLSPTAFSMAVHNASAGLFSIARADRAHHVALAAGASTVEHAVIEACGLLADGAPQVLLVACDCPLPAPFAEFEDCAEQAHAWAWLMVPAAADPIALSWLAERTAAPSAGLPGGLDVLRFQLSGQTCLERVADARRWRWSRDV
ncbi:MAG: beta-ketoacyl synthase chain length factor [Pseudomonadota bacterium]